MPGYGSNALYKFQHPKPNRAQGSPYPTTAKQYGVKVQLTDPIDTTACLPPHEIKHLQQIIGTFLFYGRAVDPTLLTALSELSSTQAMANDATKRACPQFLDYCATCPPPPPPPAQSATTPATCSSNFTATPRTSMQSVPAAAKAVISSLATNPILISSMAPSSISPPL